MILGSYRLDDILGEGGMGVVYLATHRRLGRRVAIKILKPELANDPPARRRFFGEARAVNKIAHQNIIEVTDFVERPGEANYYVMELLEGVNVAELVSIGGMLALPRAVGIMTQLAQALGAVHRAGIVHLDVKPHNIILVERSGRSDFVKLVDFGIAQTIEVHDEESYIPEAHGSGLATARYMSPEQATNLPVDYRSDTYSFGVTFYELVTGKPPDKPTEIPGLPPALERVILSCLEPDPRNRPLMEDIVEKLVAIAADQGWTGFEFATPSQLGASSSQLHAMSQLRASSPQVTFAPTPVPVVPKRRVWPLLLLVTVALGIVATTIFVMRSRGPSKDDRVRAALTMADERIAAGRIVAPNKDGALDHLLRARELDPDHPGVHDRLNAIARKYEQLAEQAFAADSLSEAAAHLQTVLVVEPTNEAAAAKMNEIEAEILVRQRITPTVP